MDDLSKPALEHVMDDTIQFHPAKFKNTYKHWMENIRDWCISRQLWWGHRIPAWYLPDGAFVVAENEEGALKLAQEKDASLKLEDLKQEEDVLDTWASSWLWPISVFNGLTDPDNEDINYYYPTADLVTAPEILFFWVARMIIAGYEYKDQFPFKNVYLTGIVRDKQRRKMSKSLGNSPDPLDLIKIYGADGVRTGMLFSSPAGNDLLFDEKLCEQGRNFSNKIWNAYRLVTSWEVDESLDGKKNELAIEWFDSKLNAAIIEIEDHFSKYRISDALMTIYKLIWNDFCSWYLEMIKPDYQKRIDPATLKASVAFFEELMKILHPLMPFITEEIWHQTQERSEDDCIVVAEYPLAKEPNAKLIEETDGIFEAISTIRNIRNEKQIAKSKALDLCIKTEDKAKYESYFPIIQKLANIENISFVEEKVENASHFVLKADEFYVPLEGNIDVEKEKENVTKEIGYLEGFIKSVDKKLSNEKFVNNAPAAVVDKEKQKRADAESKLAALKESLKHLG